VIAKNKCQKYVQALFTSEIKNSKRNYVLKSISSASVLFKREQLISFNLICGENEIMKRAKELQDEKHSGVCMFRMTCQLHSKNLTKNCAKCLIKRHKNKRWWNSKINCGISNKNYPSTVNSNITNVPCKNMSKDQYVV